MLFEVYCCKELKEVVVVCLFVGCVMVLDSVVMFILFGGCSEEIDIVVVIGCNIFIFEVKCIFWFDDVLQFINYYDIVVGVIVQIECKCIVVVVYLEVFR